MTSVDQNGNSIKIEVDGLVRVDGIGAFRRVEHNERVYLQFCDHDRMRIKCRGTKFVEIPLDVLVEIVKGTQDE